MAYKRYEHCCGLAARTYRFASHNLSHKASHIPYWIISLPLGSNCHVWECNTFSAVGHNNRRPRCQPFSIANDWNNGSLSSDIAICCIKRYPPLRGSHSDLPLPPPLRIAVQCNFDRTDNLGITLHIIPSSHLALSRNRKSGWTEAAQFSGAWWPTKGGISTRNETAGALRRPLLSSGRVVP
jgi:hypothetical protein